MWEGAEDIDEISNVLWGAGKVVKFLSFRLREISRVLDEGRIKWETYDGDLSLDNSVVVGRVAYRLENFVQSSFGGSPGGHGCMEGVKGDWEEEVRVRVDYEIFNLVHQTVVWPCLRSGTGDPGQLGKFDKKSQEIGERSK